MRFFAWVFVVALATVPHVSAIQNPQDVTFVIAPKGVKSTFRVGEQVDIEFRLSTTTPRRYVVDQLYRGNHRTIRLGSPFAVEPTAGTADPWLDVPWLIDGYGGGVLSTEPQYLSGTPLVSTAVLNEWVSFRNPGRYRISATTRQIGVPLRSNSIEIEIVAAEPGWADAKLVEAVALLNTGTAQMEAARTLSFLNTESAARRLVEFFSKPSTELYTREQLRFGVWASPYRKEVLTAMELALESPGVPIDQRWMDTLVQLAAATVAGPRPLFPARDGNDAATAQAQYQIDESRYMAQFPPVTKRYYDKLAEVVERKQGQALVVTRQTLANRRR